MERHGRPDPKPLQPFELPSGRSRTTEAVYLALEAELPDARYPAHDEEAFQAQYPRKGNGGYGSPAEF